MRLLVAARPLALAFWSRAIYRRTSSLPWRRSKTRPRMRPGASVCAVPCGWQEV